MHWSMKQAEDYHQYGIGIVETTVQAGTEEFKQVKNLIA